MLRPSCGELSPARRFFLFAIAATLVVSACSSTVDGSGSAGSAVAAPGSSVPGQSVPGSPGPTPTTTDFARPLASTAIGDPPTADLCGAIGLSAFAGHGLTPVLDREQYVGSCQVDLMKAGQLALAVYVTAGQPGSVTTRTGGTTSTVSGRPVTSYRLDSTIGSCARLIQATGVEFEIDTYNGSLSSRSRLLCSAADVMTRRVVAVAGGPAPRLTLASPSLATLDLCRVVNVARLPRLTVFLGGTTSSQEFRAQCAVKSPTARLYVNVIMDLDPSKAPTAKTTVGVHTLYSDGPNDDAVCSYTSRQGRTGSGRTEEELSFTGLAVDDKNPPPGLCQQIATAVGEFLDTAGRR